LKAVQSVVLALFLLLSLSGGRLAAQSEWMLDVSVGHVSHQGISARVATTGVVAGIRQEGGGPGWAYLFGGLPLQADGVSWGAGGLGRRLAASRGAVSVGADLGAHLLGYRDAAPATGSAVTLEVLPVIGVRRGVVDVEARSGLLQHTDFYADTVLTRRIHDSGARARALVHPAVAVQADARYVRAPEADYPYVGGTVQAGVGTGLAWVVAGRWLSDTLATAELGIGIGGRVGERWELRASWQQEPTSPLYWNPPRRGWSVQVSRRLGRTAALLPGPSAIRDAEGRIAIRLPVSESPSAPSVLGDFSGWQPLPMTREGESWTARLAVAPGLYRYGFRDAEGRWFLPASLTHRVSDGMGGESGVLLVP
jgi:hypothetical protein